MSSSYKLVCHIGQPVVDDTQKPNPAQMGFLQQVSMIRQHLMGYINAGDFFEDPEKAWQELIAEQKSRQKAKAGQSSLFPQWEGICFKGTRKTWLKAPKSVTKFQFSGFTGQQCLRIFNQ